MYIRATLVSILLAATAAAQTTITAPRVRYGSPNAAFNYFPPIKVRVRASDVRGLSNVQVRVFANRTLDRVKTVPEGTTTSGCYIIKSRVDPYEPSFLEPDILLREIYDVDLRCRSGELAPTPFVLVIESAELENARFLRIEPKQIPKYFRYAYTFTVTPARGQSCGNPAKPLPVTAGGAPKPSASEKSLVVDADAPVESCITEVKQ